MDVLVEEGEISPAAAAALYTLITILPDSELDAVFAGLGGAGTAVTSLARIAKGNRVVLPSQLKGKITQVEYANLRLESVHNSNADTLVLGRYVPSIKNGKPDYSNPTTESYNVVAKKEEATYFDMGDRWGSVQSQYNLNDDQMFEVFNIPVLDDAVKKVQTIKFTHDPRIVETESFLFKEWEYLKQKHGYRHLQPKNGEWYAEK